MKKRFVQRIWQKYSRRNGFRSLVIISSSSGLKNSALFPEVLSIIVYFIESSK